jgi:hypothetical protein
VILGIAIFSCSALPISLPILTFLASPARDYRSPIFSVGIPIKFHYSLFLPPLRFLRTPPTTLLFLPSLDFLFMPGLATLSQCCMVAAGSSPARKFSASVNSTSDVTCIVDTSLPVCLISEAAAARCTLSVDRAQTVWVPALSDPDLVSLGLALMC